MPVPHLFKKKKKLYSRESIFRTIFVPNPANMSVYTFTNVKNHSCMETHDYCSYLIAYWIAIHNSGHNIYTIFYTVKMKHFQCVKAKGKKKK